MANSALTQDSTPGKSVNFTDIDAGQIGQTGQYRRRRESAQCGISTPGKSRTVRDIDAE
jgi:hypothetical protein